MAEVHSTVDLGVLGTMSLSEAPPLAEKVLFETDDTYTEGHRGVYYPSLRTVVVNLHKCMTDDLFKDWGLLYSARVYTTIMYTIYHEFEHARQLQNHPELINADSLPEYYEREADLYALSRVHEIQDIPTLEELGWVGETIRMVLVESGGEKELYGAERGFAASWESLHRGNYQPETLQRVENLMQGEIIGEKLPGGVFLRVHEVSKLRADYASGSKPFGEEINDAITKGGGPMDNKTRVEFITHVAAIMHALRNGQQMEFDPKFFPWISSQNYHPTKGGLPMWDFDLNINGQMLQLRFVVQNPFKQNKMGQLSQYAVLAQQGHQITWLINRGTNTFLGRVQDDQWIKNQPRVNNLAPQTINQVMSQVPNLPYVPPPQVPQYMENQNYGEYESGGGEWVHDNGDLTFYAE